MSLHPLEQLEKRIIACDLCPRLRAHSMEMARLKRRAWREWDYWGKPVPGFGDRRAKLLIVGLAPGAHGSNRTGRMFTGDASGDLLYRVLHATGFASRPESTSRDDGLVLRSAYITAAARCAPPDNKPSGGELANCRGFLKEEMRLLRDVRVVVALGKVAFDSYLAAVGAKPSAFEFGHDREHTVEPPLISSYHPSQQNTSTGRLTEAMLLAVFRRARSHCGKRG